MSDLEPPANRLLTANAPTPADGTPEGRAQDGPSQPEAGSKPDPENSGPTAASEPEPKPSAPDPAVQAHLLGVPDSLPPTWCPNCKADVLPKGKGYCPRCARMLKGSFLARRHPVNVLRKKQLLDKLVADYKPSTTMLLASCEHLAGILEQLETLKPGSPEHQRLVQLSQQLGAALEESRPARTTETYEDASLDKLTERHAQLGQLIEHLRLNAEMEQQLAADANACGTVYHAPPTEPAAPPSAPEPLCGYGCGSLARCAELKATRLDNWRALHYEDPQEVTRRDADATIVMMRQIGKSSPYL